METDKKIGNENVIAEKNAKKDVRIRVANIMQYLKHPETGEQLISLDVVKKVLSEKKMIAEYAYIIHDKDEKSDGTLKPPHLHLVIKFTNPIVIDNIAKWFGIEKNFIQIPKGRGGFDDCCRYLTHELCEEKHVYDETDVIANFDYSMFCETMRKKEIRKSRGLKENEIKHYYRMKVLTGKMTLNECYLDNPDNYVNDFKYLDSCRKEFLLKQPYPDHRTNYYICGGGGYGKSICSVALARSLFPDFDRDEEIFFPVGGENVTFEGYDGQPVIIWNDCRAIELLKKFGGRGNLFDFFDPYPKAQNKQNIKYGSIRLLNTVNIVNSVDDYEKFLDGLAGEYGDYKVEDKTQSYRRFPFIIPLHINDFELLINKGYLKENGNYNEYERYLSITGNFRKLHSIYGNKVETVKMFEKKMLDDVAEKSMAIMNKKRDAEFMRKHIDDVAEILNYGKVIGGSALQENNINVSDNTIILNKNGDESKKENAETVEALFNEFS